MWVTCRRCKRPLKTKQSKLLGYGKVCYQKQVDEDNARFARIQTTIFDYIGGERDEKERS